MLARSVSINQETSKEMDIPAYCFVRDGHTYLPIVLYEMDIRTCLLFCMRWTYLPIVLYEYHILKIVNALLWW